eukprot:875050-Prymnesium_polylepis.1
MKYLSGWKLLGLLIEPGWKIGVFLARLLARMITGDVSLGGDPSAIQFANVEEQTLGDALQQLMEGEAGRTTVADMR